MLKIIIPVHASNRIPNKSCRPYFDTGESLLDRTILLANSLGHIPTIIHPEGFTPIWTKGVGLTLQLPPGSIIEHLEATCAILGDDLCLLQCTSPYIKRETIQRCLTAYTGEDTVYTSHPRKPCRAIGNPPKDHAALTRQEGPANYHTPFQLQDTLDYYWDGGCVIFNGSTLRANGTIFSDRSTAITTTQLEAWQVDDPNDMLGGPFQ